MDTVVRIFIFFVWIREKYPYKILLIHFSALGFGFNAQSLV
jgi:hypothetical protein